MFENNNTMKEKMTNFIALILVGIINGLFASGAGQILVFYYVYILKKDTKEAREKSLMIVPIISILTMLFYIRKSNIEFKNVFILVIISIVFGTIGNLTMKKVNSNVLNFTSGLFLIIISAISLWRMFI